MSKPALPPVSEVIVGALTAGLLAPWLLIQSQNKKLTAQDRSIALLLGTGTIGLGYYNFVRGIARKRKQ